MPAWTVVLGCRVACGTVRGVDEAGADGRAVTEERRAAERLVDRGAGVVTDAGGCGRDEVTVGDGED